MKALSGDLVACSPRVLSFDSSEFHLEARAKAEGTIEPDVLEDSRPGVQEEREEELSEWQYHSGEEQDIEASCDPAVYPLTIDNSFQSSDTPLNAVSWEDESHPMWVIMRTVMDSVAAQSVAPPSMVPKVSIEESPGSKKGQH